MCGKEFKTRLGLREGGFLGRFEAVAVAQHRPRSEAPGRKSVHGGPHGAGGASHAHVAHSGVWAA